MTQTQPMNFGPITDHDLLANFVERGHEPAFAEVVQRHGGMVLSVCRSVLGNTSDAEDAAQAVFLTLARKAHSSSVRSHLVGWLHRVAWYVSARGVAARAVRLRHEREASKLREEVRQAEPESIQTEWLHAGLAELPEKYRVALILHHLEGRSHAETAALSGCSVDAVAVRLHRGREMLRKQLKRKNVALSAAILAGMWVAPEFAGASPAFVATSARAASAVLAGPLTSTAIVTGQTMALSQGALAMLYYAKLKAAMILIATVLLTGGAVGAAIALHTSNLPVTTPTPVAAGPTVASPSLPASTPMDLTVFQPNALPQPITGVVTHVTQDSITIRRRIGPAVNITWTAATVVKIDDMAATTAGLKEGMSVAAFRQGEEPAVEIRAYSAPPPKAEK